MATENSRKCRTHAIAFASSTFASFHSLPSYNFHRTSLGLKIVKDMRCLSSWLLEENTSSFMKDSVHDEGPMKQIPTATIAIRQREMQLWLWLLYRTQVCKSLPMEVAFMSHLCRIYATSVGGNLHTCARHSSHSHSCMRLCRRESAAVLLYHNIIYYKI